MKTLEKEIQTKQVRDLFKAILVLKSQKECTSFLRDLLTVEEIKELSRRWQVAKMLSKNKTFIEIEKKTGMSSATITRINYWIHHGTGGYRELLKRVK